MKHHRSGLLILATPPQPPPRPSPVLSRDELRRAYLAVLIELARMSGDPKMFDRIERLLGWLERPGEEAP